MTYLIDSDWIADYLKGRPNAVAVLEQLRPAGIAVSAVTLVEVYEGIFSGPDIFIAATAIQHGLSLVSRNNRHFRRVPDLTLHAPS